MLNIPTGCVHADETGIQIENENHWLHTLSTENYTYQFVHKRRGKEALLSEKSMMSNLRNWLVHDCWSTYFNFPDLYPINLVRC
jgi:transposase